MISKLDNRHIKILQDSLEPGIPALDQSGGFSLFMLFTLQRTLRLYRVEEVSGCSKGWILNSEERMG